MDYSDSEDDTYNDVNFWRVSPMVFLPMDGDTHNENGKVDGSGNDVHTDVDDNSLNNSTGDVVMVESGIPREKDRGLIIPKDAYHLVITRDLSGKSAEASSQLLANVLNRLTENYLYLNDDGPKMSKLAERADELRKELMSAQKELEGVSGPYDDYFVREWKRSVVNQVKAEADIAEIELEKGDQDKDLLDDYPGLGAGVDKELTMPRKFEVKATPRSDTATTATTCTSFMNLLATGAYDGDDGIALPKHSVAFRIVSNRVIEGHDSGRVKVPVSGREVPLTKCEFEISVTGKVMKDAHAVWDGCEWSPADFTADEDYCNVNGDAESAVELQFDQGIVMLEYASVLQVLNRIAFVHHVLDKAGDIGPQLNTAIALLEALSLGKCRSFPIYYNGPYLARLHVAARHVVNDGPWARRLSNELRARCACLLACNLRQIVPDDSRCPCTVDGMIDQVGRSTRGLSSGDLTVNERRLLDIVERPF